MRVTALILFFLVMGCGDPNKSCAASSQKKYEPTNYQGIKLQRDTLFAKDLRDTFFNDYGIEIKCTKMSEALVDEHWIKTGKFILTGLYCRFDNEHFNYIFETFKKQYGTNYQYIVNENTQYIKVTWSFSKIKIILERYQFFIEIKSGS